MSTTLTELPAKLQGQSKQARGFLVERAAIDEAARTARLAFASETPYERYWGVEILDCTSTAMRQGRLSSGANLLCDHDTRDVVGVVESVEIGADRVARAVVRFGKSARAEEVWRDVVDGIRRNVSVGYMIHKAQLVESVDGLDTYRVTDWEPFEVSLVSVPADATVGVGRSAVPAIPEQRGVCVSVSVEIEAECEDDAEDDSEDGLAADPDELAAQAISDTPPSMGATPSQSEKGHAVSDVQVVAERNHAAEISKIAATIPGGADMALSAIQRGLTVEQFQGEVLTKMASKPLPTADIGMSSKEVRSYSVVRAINALANPQDAAIQRAAAFERECSDAAAAKMGKASRGMFVPFDVQKRDLVVGTATAGGNLVQTDLLAGSFIDLLRNAMVIQGMGTRILSGLQGNVAIPKQTGAATAFWVAENTAPTESQQTVGQVTMTPKTVGAFTDIGRRLLVQSSVDVENMVNTDLATVLGLAIQQAAINGTGASNQPSGLLTLITPSVIGGTNGLAPTWQNMIDLETNVAVGNAAIGSLGYLTNVKMRGKLKSTQKFSGTNGQPVWDGGDTPINGYQVGVTNAVPSNLTKGTSTGVCSAIIFGNFADLMIGIWGGLDLMVDPYTGSTAGTVRVVALQDVDVAVRNVESFATMVDALTV